MWRKTSTRLCAGLSAAALGGAFYLGAGSAWDKDRSPIATALSDASRQVAPAKRLPTRTEHLEVLRSAAEFDILVVGGGATGAGVALDAATRGLKVALVEREDFASGTSSRSTKLIHGGVRYLEKAFKNLDYEQFKMVQEALFERANLLKIAPHLSCQLPIMLPIYKWWLVPYYWAGAKVYDLVSGRKRLESSYFLSKTKALEKFPMLKKEALVGAMVYYDGQHDDSRMNLAIALTAASEGAAIANYVEVVELLKRQEDGKEVIAGARVRDTLSGETFAIKARGVVNATGPFTDSLRKMESSKNENIVAPSSGVHVTLPEYYSPHDMGLIDPSTSDGRVIFFLPWQQHTIAGTTDAPTDVTNLPKAKEEEISFILKEIRNYLNPDVQVRRGDVLSAWAGIRPLVRNPEARNTEELVRNHIVLVSDQNLITIAGGKWTTYRKMALETVDKAIEVFKLQPSGPSRTEEVLLVGGHEYSPTMFIKLIQTYGIERVVAEHLASSYGDRAFEDARHAKPSGKHWPVLGNRLDPQYPYIEEEIIFAVHYEMACKATVRV